VAGYATAEANILGMIDRALDRILYSDKGIDAPLLRTYGPHDRIPFDELPWSKSKFPVTCGQRSGAVLDIEIDHHVRAELQVHNEWTQYQLELVANQKCLLDQSELSARWKRYRLELLDSGQCLLATSRHTHKSKECRARLGGIVVMHGRDGYTDFPETSP